MTAHIVLVTVHSSVVSGTSRVHTLWFSMTSSPDTKVASNPGFPFWILSRRFGEKSSKLQDKIWNGKPGFKAYTKVQNPTGVHQTVWSG